MGISRRATNRDTVSVEIMETTTWIPSSFIMYSDEKRNGRKTVMVVNVAATIDLHTSEVP